MRVIRRNARYALLCLTLLPVRVEAQANELPRWRIDVNHSEMQFRVRYLISRVPGTFNEWQGELRLDPANLATGSVEVTVNTASIDTRQERRDNHLRSADFFDVQNHPTMTFRSTRVEVDGQALRVHGDLTIRGVTRPVVLTGEYTGSIGSGEAQRLAFTATTTVNRQDFGVAWNRAAEGGGLVLADEVQIDLTIQAVRVRAQ